MAHMNQEAPKGYRFCHCRTWCPAPRLVAVSTWYRHNPGCEDSSAHYTPQTAALAGLVSHVPGKRQFDTNDELSDNIEHAESSSKCIQRLSDEDEDEQLSSGALVSASTC